MSEPEHDQFTQTSPEAARAAAAALATGGFVVLAEGREDDSHGNLTVAADLVTPERIAYLSNRGQGVVRLCLTDERCAELGLTAAAADGGGSDRDWQPTAAITHRSVSGSGASASDRAATILAAADPSQGRDDFVSGGYVFPLRARADGVLRRAGRTEAAIDLARLAGRAPAAAMSLLMNEDGSVALGAQLEEHAAALGVPFVTVGDVIAQRLLSDKLVERVTSTRLPTRHGEFTAVGFRETMTGDHHVALVKGELEGVDGVIVRVHSECLVGDVFATSACTCRHDMDRSLELIEEEGRGVLLYLVGAERQRRFGHGEPWRHRPYSTAMEEYGVGAQILAELGLGKIRLITDHPRAIQGLEGFGLEIVGHVPING